MAHQKVHRKGMRQLYVQDLLELAHGQQLCSISGGSKEPRIARSAHAVGAIPAELGRNARKHTKAYKTRHIKDSLPWTQHSPQHHNCPSKNAHAAGPHTTPLGLPLTYNIPWRWLMHHPRLHGVPHSPCGCSSLHLPDCQLPFPACSFGEPLLVVQSVVDCLAVLAARAQPACH